MLAWLLLILCLFDRQELNAEPVIPDSFPEWVDVMNGWGHKMIAAVEVYFFHPFIHGCIASTSRRVAWVIRF